jgi:hypothetical protein
MARALEPVLDGPCLWRHAGVSNCSLSAHSKCHSQATAGEPTTRMGSDGPEDLSSEDFERGIAHRYYTDGPTQEESGREVGLSRPKVPRLLERARWSGVVEIRVAAPPWLNLDLETRWRVACRRDSGPAPGGSPVAAGAVARSAAQYGAAPTTAPWLPWAWPRHGEVLPARDDGSTASSRRRGGCRAWTRPQTPTICHALAAKRRSLLSCTPPPT